MKQMWSDIENAKQNWNRVSFSSFVFVCENGNNAIVHSRDENFHRRKDQNKIGIFPVFNFVSETLFRVDLHIELE